MSYKTGDKFYQGTSQPVGAGLGDEWFNTTTNRLYQYVGLSGNAPTWVEIPMSPTANTVTINNVSVAGKGTFSGTPTSLALTAPNFVESVTLYPTAPLSLVNLYVSAQTVIYASGAAGSNLILNITGSATTLLNAMLSVGQSVTIAYMMTNTAIGYYINNIRVDGVAPTILKWQNGSSPTSGNANSIDSYTFSIIKTADATFTVLASQAKFA